LLPADLQPQQRAVYIHKGHEWRHFLGSVVSITDRVVEEGGNRTRENFFRGANVLPGDLTPDRPHPWWINPEGSGVELIARHASLVMHVDPSSSHGPCWMQDLCITSCKCNMSLKFGCRVSTDSPVTLTLMHIFLQYFLLRGDKLECQPKWFKAKCGITAAQIA
jgi:hypothetical protein